MSYATKDDVSTYTGLELAELPDDIDRLIKRASEMVDYATFDRLKHTSDQDLLDAAKDATSAQVEYWLVGVGEGTDIHGHVKQYSIGKFSMELSNGMPKLSPRARRYLWSVGLYNKGAARTPGKWGW